METGLVSRPWLSWLQDLATQVSSQSSGSSDSGGGAGTGGAGGAGGPITNISVLGTTGSGSADRLAKWVDATALGDSIISEAGTIVHVDGTLNALTLQGALDPSYLVGFPHDPKLFLDGSGHWSKPPAHIVGEVAGGAIDGVNRTFTTAAPASELAVFLNGLQLTRVIDWDMNTTSTFTIFIPPLSTAPTDIVTVSYLPL